MITVRYCEATDYWLVESPHGRFWPKGDPIPADRETIVYGVKTERMAHKLANLLREKFGNHPEIEST